MTWRKSKPENLNHLYAELFYGKVKIHLLFLSMDNDIAEVPFILQSGYNGWWWPGDARSQGISSHGIDLLRLGLYRPQHQQELNQNIHWTAYPGSSKTCWCAPHSDKYSIIYSAWHFENGTTIFWKFVSWLSLINLRKKTLTYSNNHSLN